MPIVSGQYQSPAWVNDQTPAIDASELNDLCGTVEDLDSEMGPAQDAITALQQDMSDAQEDIADAQTDIATLQNTAYIEKTVSGPIASFSDGAALPVKDLTAQIVATQGGSGDPSPTNIRPIVGGGSITITGASSNVWSAIDIINQGGISATGGDSSTNQEKRCRSSFLGVAQNTTYTIACAEGVEIGAVHYYARNTRASWLYRDALVGSPVTFTTPTGCHYIRVLFLSANGGTDDITPEDVGDVMLNVGSTALPYEAAIRNNVSVNWETEAGTIYGGTLNVTTGALTVTHGHVTLDGTETVTPPPMPPVGARVWLWTISGVLTNEGVRNGNIIADRLRGVNGNTTSPYCVRISAASDLALYMPTDTFHSAEDVSEWLVNNNVSIAYELASPTTYQLTPTEVSTLLGQNNVWSNTGDIAVTYRADPSLVIAALESRINATQNIIAGVETSMVATKNYSIGDLLIVGDALYKATAAIANGGTITVGTNVAATTVAEQLLLLANA